MENGYMATNTGVTLLCTWKYHDFVKSANLQYNKKSKKERGGNFKSNIIISAKWNMDVHFVLILTKYSGVWRQLHKQTYCGERIGRLEINRHVDGFQFGAATNKASMKIFELVFLAMNHFVLFCLLSLVVLQVYIQFLNINVF